MSRYSVELSDSEVAELRALLPAGRQLRRRSTRRRETEDYTATVRRMLAGLAKRAEGDVDQLPELARLRDLVEDVIAQHVRACRQIDVPWSEIGERLGTTKQAAQQRYMGRGPAGSRERQHGVDDVALPFEATS